MGPNWVKTVNADLPDYDQDGWGPKLNGHGPAAAAANDDIHRNQLRMAYRLSAAYENHLLHVYQVGWHFWDDARWAKDEGQCVAEEAVDTTLKAALREALDLPSTLRDELLVDARRCEKATGFHGVLELATYQKPFATVVSDLNADPYLLNCANGTLDLRTGDLRPADPLDRITKVTGTAYDPDATSRLFEQFLQDALPDEEVRAFLARIMGLSLVGKVIEHILPIFTGTGRNGKGTFILTVSAALGDYAMEAEPELFLVRDRAHPTGQLDLLGARFVTCQETDEGKPLAVATVKRLTGGDTIRARAMRRDFVQFTPSHLPVMITNHLPRVPADDPALWARLMVVPWNISFIGREDPTLGDKLKDELPAVLAWAVAGYQEYQRIGLAPPDAVTTATKSYKSSSDALAQFIEEKCLIGDAYYAQSSDLWHAWSEWCRACHEEAGNNRRFKELLEGRGYHSRHTHVGAVFAGLALAAPEDDEPPISRE